MTFKTFTAVACVLLLAACSDSGTSSTSGSGTALGGGAGAGGSGIGRGLPGSQEDLASTVGDRVFYESDRSQLTPQARATLDGQAGWLARYAQNKVMVAGNCDERGTTEYNLALGQRRANAARDYLLSKGVSAARMRTISYGKERPSDPGSNEAAWSKNRNATTTVE